MASAALKLKHAWLCCDVCDLPMFIGDTAHLEVENDVVTRVTCEQCDPAPEAKGEKA